MIEQEVKLAFVDHEAARQAVHTAGGRLVASRRLIDDRLVDTPDGRLRSAGTALRIRRDGDRTLLTFKGPVQPGVVKSREELETAVEDRETIEAIIPALGYRQVFRSEKYREEYELAGAHVTIDETPIGVFVEIEGSEAAIAEAAGRLGRSPSDYVVESYFRLYREWCRRHDVTPGDMTFHRS